MDELDTGSIIRYSFNLLQEKQERPRAQKVSYISDEVIPISQLYKLRKKMLCGSLLSSPFLKGGSCVDHSAPMKPVSEDSTEEVPDLIEDVTTSPESPPVTEEVPQMSLKEMIADVETVKGLDYATYRIEYMKKFILQAEKEFPFLNDPESEDNYLCDEPGKKVGITLRFMHYTWETFTCPRHYAPQWDEYVYFAKFLKLVFKEIRGLYPMFDLYKGMSFQKARMEAKRTGDKIALELIRWIEYRVNNYNPWRL